jgi:hypothetical protein
MVWFSFETSGDLRATGHLPVCRPAPCRRGRRRPRHAAGPARAGPGRRRSGPGAPAGQRRRRCRPPPGRRCPCRRCSCWPRCDRGATCGAWAATTTRTPRSCLPPCSRTTTPIRRPGPSCSPRCPNASSGRPMWCNCPERGFGADRLRGRTGGRHRRWRQEHRRADAMRHVFGYTIVNDVTARDVQMRHQQWDLGKSVRHLLPDGPVDRDRRRTRRPQDACALLGQRRVAPGRTHRPRP